MGKYLFMVGFLGLFEADDIYCQQKCHCVKVIHNWNYTPISFLATKSIITELNLNKNAAFLFKLLV